jgi:hypothetical protein
LPDAEAARLKALIADLGAADWEKREAASRGIAVFGTSAAAALDAAKSSSDPEIASRAEQLLKQLQPSDESAGPLHERLDDLWMF